MKKLLLLFLISVPVISKSQDLKLNEREYFERILDFLVYEIAFIDAFLSKKYQPEVLFSEPTIIDNIRNHPMALWKIKE